MEIDVKNALNKLLAACDAIDAEINDGSQMIKKDVVADIISFIRVISKADAAERVQLFKTMYLDGDYEDTCDSTDVGSAVPSSFDKLCRLDNSLLKSSGMKTAALYIAFIVELGKHYLHSRYDKGAIDQQKYLDYIKTLQMHQKASQNITDNNQTQLNGNQRTAEKSA